MDPEKVQKLSTFWRNVRFAQPVTDYNYQTPLAAPSEVRFRQWVQQNKIPFDPNDQMSDYDMRGFWQAQQANDPRAQRAIDPYSKQLHFPDVWKTPFHQSFSNESMYATPSAPKWNDKGQLVNQQNGQVVFDGNQP